MYGKYMLFYESPKNGGYLRACANSVYQASPRGGAGNEASVHVGKRIIVFVKTKTFRWLALSV